MMLTPGVWYPVAAGHDLAPGHIYQTQLGGTALAIWRAGDGTVQVWEDRCPHRGMRFSLGEIVDDTLVCRYHAWRFAAGGRCRFIPAQPNVKPPGTIRAAVWPAAESGDVVWTGHGPAGGPVPGTGVPFRAIPVDRAAEHVQAAIAGFTEADLVLQPLAPGRCVIRGWCAPARLATVDAALEALRRTLEAPC